MHDILSIQEEVKELLVKAGVPARKSAKLMHDIQQKLHYPIVEQAREAYFEHEENYKMMIDGHEKRATILQKESESIAVLVKDLKIDVLMHKQHNKDLMMAMAVINKLVSLTIGGTNERT